MTDTPTLDAFLDQAAARFDGRANTLRRDARILEARAEELEDVARTLRSDAAGYRMTHDDEPTLLPAGADPPDEPTIVMDAIRP